MSKIKIIALVTIILAVALADVLVFGGFGKSLASKAVEIPAKVDYNLIPVYTLDGNGLYLNAGVTPLQFFSIYDKDSAKQLSEIQITLGDIKQQKPLVFVATFFKDADINKAIKDTQSFITKNKIQGTVVIQGGPPRAFVKNVPALVTMEKDKSKPIIIEGVPSKDQLNSTLTVATTKATNLEKEKAQTQSESTKK